MPTVESKEHVDELRELLNQFIEQTGESVTSVAARAGVGREYLSLFRSGSSNRSPQAENLVLIARAIGYELSWKPAKR